MLDRVTDQPRPIDWVIHFLVGTFIYGSAMAILAWHFADQLLDHWCHSGRDRLDAGLAHFDARWRVGVFGLKIGVSALAMTMMMHVRFGALVGLVYGWLV